MISKYLYKKIIEVGEGDDIYQEGKRLKYKLTRFYNNFKDLIVRNNLKHNKLKMKSIINHQL